jgi:hypothetical protein
MVCFGLVFRLNLGFQFGSWLNRCFWVNLVESKSGQILKALFDLPLFDKMSFGLRACLTNTFLDMF